MYIRSNLKFLISISYMVRMRHGWKSGHLGVVSQIAVLSAIVNLLIIWKENVKRLLWLGYNNCVISVVKEIG